MIIALFLAMGVLLGNWLLVPLVSKQSFKDGFGIGIIAGILVFLIMLFVSCQPCQPPKTERYEYSPFTNSIQLNNGMPNIWDARYKIIVVDGCEYFTLPSSQAYIVLTHKGNCTNRIHYIHNLENK